MRDSSTHVKVLFEIEGEDGKKEVESMWAIPEDGLYRIDNIPFYAKLIACDDRIAAEPDETGALCFVRVVQGSGHSTVRLWFARAADVQTVRDRLRARECESELDLERLLAVDIPPDVPYDEVRAFLDEQEAAGVLEYEEACLVQG